MNRILIIGLILIILGSSITIIVFRCDREKSGETITEIITFTETNTTTTITILTMTTTTITKSSYNENEINAYEYLRSNFNETLGLIFENNEDEGLNETYWIYSDNYLALLAIWDHNETLKIQIQNAIIHYEFKYDISPSYLYEVILGMDIPDVIRVSETTLLGEGVDYEIWVDRRTGNVMHDWENYGDLLLYKSLDYYLSENFVEAEDCYNKAYNMFDGKGIYDVVARIPKRNGICYYDNYKLALLIYTSSILHKNLDQVQPLMEHLWSMQNETSGGIIARAYMDGTPAGSANCETTAWTLIACMEAKQVDFD